MRSRNLVEAILIETHPRKLGVMLRSCMHYGAYNTMKYTGQRLLPCAIAPGPQDDSTIIMFQVGRTITVVAPKSIPARSRHSHNLVTFVSSKAPSVAPDGQVSRGSRVAIEPSMVYRPLVPVQVVPREVLVGT